MLIIKQRQVRVKMADLTKYYKKEQLILDKNFAFVDKSKSVSDLVAEMQTHGLLIDSFIETTGELVRCRVAAIGGQRPDKGNEFSGWYVFNQLDNAWVCVFGNWRSGFEGKMTSYSADQLTASEKQRISRQLEDSKKRAEEGKKIRQDQVAVYAEEKFNAAEDVTEHKYLTDKKVKSYGLKQTNGNLLVPVHSIIAGDNNTLVRRIKSLQYIFPNGDKRFVGGGEVRGNIHLLNCEINNLNTFENIYVVEGYATGATIASFGLPVCVVFSASFTLSALSRLRERGITSKFVLCLDNDENGVGKKYADETVKACQNCSTKLPSILGDYNDLYIKNGAEAVKSELLDQKRFNLQQYAIRNLTTTPREIEWLIDGFLPLRKPGIIAAIGGIGKSLEMLGLSLSVIGAKDDWWGKPVQKRGDAVVICAEDTQDEIERRIWALDPEGKRFNAPYDLYVFPVPEQKEPMTLLKEEGITEQAVDLISELKSLSNNLVLSVFDPLQAFTTAPISASNEAGQAWGSFCSNLSARIGCTTLTVHHLNKGSLTNDSDDSLTHRQEVRGASSIVDSQRFCISLWLASEEDSERICAEQGIDFDRMAVVKAAMVKSNTGGVDFKTKTLIRRPNQAALELVQDKKSFEWN